MTYILAAITGILILVADQFTKYFVPNYYAVNNLDMGQDWFELIPGIININYIHNDGAAWGMLSGHTWLLLSVTFVVMLVCVALLLKYGAGDKLMFWAMCLVLSGGMGNMIDRVFRDGKVIDFLQFGFWTDFPIFNIADCAIVIGAGLLLLYFFKGIIDEEKQKRSIAAFEASQKNENI